MNFKVSQSNPKSRIQTFTNSVVLKTLVSICSISATPQTAIGDLCQPPAFLGSYNTPGNSYDVAVVGTTAYVADGSQGLQIIDVSDPGLPVFLGSYSTQNANGGVAAVGTTVYLVSGSRLLIIDASDPANPELIGSRSTPSVARDVEVVDSIAYVADDNFMQIMDVSNPPSIGLLGSVSTADLALGIAVEGTKVFLATFHQGLQVIDVSDPSSPFTISSFITPDTARGVAVANSVVYVADSTSLQIIDASTSQLALLSSIPMSSCWDVSIFGSTAFVAAGGGGLKMFDIYNPASPSSIGTYDTPGSAQGIARSGTTTYVADRSQGLQIVEVVDCHVDCFADLTGDFVLDFFDVSVFLTYFQLENEIADFTGDGEFDFFDVSAFLTEFSAGCP